MVQFPKLWFGMLYMGIKSYVMSSSEYDPYLLIGNKLIFVIYFDNCILFAKEDKYIDDLVDKICDKTF